MSSAKRVARKLGRKKARRWIQKMHMHKGALHRALGIPEGESIPLGLLEKAAKEVGHLGRQARLALTLRGLPHHHGPR